MFEHTTIHVVAEADTLQTDAGDAQGSCSIELGRFIVILRRHVLPAGQGFLYDRLGRLRKRLSVRLDLGKLENFYLCRQGLPFLNGKIVHSKSLVGTGVVPLAVLVVKTF